MKKEESKPLKEDADASKAMPKEDSSLKNLVVKQGDYQIHVLVEKVIQLSTVKDELPDPVVKITAVGDDKRTKKIGIKVKEHEFDEHMYFTHKDVNMEVFDSAKILIEVYDRNNTSKKDYIGVQEIDYATIYSNEGHFLKNYWIALSNINNETDFSVIKGYLRLSVSILHDDDKRVELSSVDNDNGMISTPPHISNKYMQLKVGFLRGEDFPDMDSLRETKLNKSCDAFISMLYLGKIISTSVVKMKDNVVVWNESLSMPFIHPTTSEKIVFKVFDEDVGSSNDLIGCFEISIHDVMNGEYITPRYISVYGGPTQTSGKFTDLMNDNSEIGSLWKGRILLSLKAEITDQPKMGKDPITISASFMNNLKKKNLWILEFELMDALFLPVESGKVCFAFAYEDIMITTPLRTVDKRNILKWNLKRKQPFYSLSNKVENLSDIFVYFCKGENDGEKSRYCFQRIPSKDICDNKDVIVFKLLADPSIDKVKECRALLRMKMKLTLSFENPDQILKEIQNGNSTGDKLDPFETPKVAPLPVPVVAPKVPEPVPVPVPVKVEVPVKKPEPAPVKKELSSDSDDLDNMVSKMPIKKAPTKVDLPKEPVPAPTTTTSTTTSSTVANQSAKVETPVVAPVQKPKVEEIGHTVIVNVYMSQDFVSGDADGTSDPYVEVTIDGAMQKTSVKNDQINGCWNESLVFRHVNFDLKDLSTWPIMFFRVMDEDPITDDALGYSYVWLSSSSYNVNSFDKLTPKWHQFRLYSSDRPQGKLLLSFFIIEDKSKNFNSLHNQIANIDISPDCDLFDFDINILGLRKLEPLGILPVRRPFIHFDLNSIIIPSKRNTSVTQHKSIKTEPIYSGANPTINTTVNFKFNLPKEEIYVPSLMSMVYDKVLIGISNNLLGLFTINLNNMIKLTNNKRIEDQEEEDRIENERKLQVLAQLEREAALAKLEEENRKESDNTDGSAEKKEKSINPIASILSVEQPANVEADANTNRKIENTATALEISNNNMEEGLLPSAEPKEKQVPQEGQKLTKAQQNKKKYKGLVNITDDRVKPLIAAETTNKLNFKEVINQIEEQSLEEERQLVIHKEKEEKLVKLIKSGTVIIMPEFHEIKLPFESKTLKTYIVEDQKLVPDTNQYFELGYENPNKPKLDNKKHYRRWYGCELEKVPELKIRCPFIKIPLLRDRFVDTLEFGEVFNQLKSKNKIIKRFTKDPNNANNFIEKSEEDESLENYNQVRQTEHGYFKGLISVMDNQKKLRFEKMLTDSVQAANTEYDYKNFKRFKDLSLELLNKKEMVCRLYILELRDLAKKDLLSESDPYLKISLAGKEIDEQKKHLDDTANAKIYRYYDFPIELPGSAELKIEVWDFDPMFSDELIGFTTIDLEDRFYDHNWQSLKDKPIETRMLHHPDLKGVQGSVIMWVELFDNLEKGQSKEWDIREPPIIPFQMRLIVWETRDIPMMDIEETSDVYVTVFVNPEKKQTTDTHFRCTNGEASFNWRILEPIDYSPKEKNCHLNIQVYDKDLLSPDEFICSASINLRMFLNQLYDVDLPFKLTKKLFNSLDLPKEAKKMLEFEEEEKFWVNCTKTDSKGVETNCGGVLCSLEILPMWKAEQVEVGNGRDEPNCNPYLPPPEGRISWSWNPFVLLGQLVGPRLRRKFYCFIICMLFSVFAVYFLPDVLRQIFAQLTNPYFWAHRS